MLGVYDYTVILTYISLWISIGGMMLSLNGHLDLAVLCLALSGLCDMFDGKIARTKKDRTEIEKRFGIQIDSLCDIVCFGVGPAIICYCMGMNGIVGVLILMFYVLAGLIRLAWFNVTEECRQDETTENRKCYQGLPITSMSIALPILVVLRPFLHCDFRIALPALVLLVGLLFAMDFKLKCRQKRKQDGENNRAGQIPGIYLWTYIDKNDVETIAWIRGIPTWRKSAGQQSVQAVDSIDCQKESD